MLRYYNQFTEPTTDVISISGFARGTDLSVSGTAAQTAALTEGFYDVWSTVDTYIKTATTANDVTTSTGYLLRAGNTITISVSDGEKIGAISGVTGTLSFHQVK